MASYTIEWKRSAVKELKQLPQNAIARIVKAVEQLAQDPYPAGVKKLIGSERTYRLRVGMYRVVYTIEADVLVITVIRVGHRKDVYR